MATLEIREGQDAGRVFQLGDEVFVGRSPQGIDPRRFLPLPDGLVSRRHVQVRRAGPGYVIEDLASTNGTIVAGQRLEPFEAINLEDGDEIRISSTVLVFRDRGGEADKHALGLTATGNASASIFLPRGGAGVPQLRLDEEPSRELSVVLDLADGQFGRSRVARRPDEDLEDALRRLQAVLEVSETLGSVADRAQLMQKILDHLFDIFTGAERAFVLLCLGDDGELLPVASKTRFVDGRADEELAISHAIVDHVVTHKRAILSVDTMGDERFDSHTSIINMSICSMMCAPLLVGDEVLGLIQVDNTSDPQAFHASDLEILAGVCAQAAIAVRNAQLYANIEELFESFIRASVQAIEARDPVTAGHSFRVAEYTERLAAAVDRADDDGLRTVRFSTDQMREIRYAALLHDFGKVGVREHVLTKPKKLYPHQLQLIQERFRYARASLERRAYYKLLQLHEQKKLSDADLLELRQATEQALATERERLDRFMALILTANEPTLSPEEVPDDLKEILAYMFPGEDGVDDQALLQDFEFSDLSFARGSLSPDERLQIESHVSHTYAFLSLIPWSGPLAKVPDIAYAHHEKLNGSGYPLGLSESEIPIQSRIMTVADIYDAITAGDRPYRRGLPAPQALDILHDEVAAGNIDGRIVRIFVESEAYRLDHGAGRT